MRYQIDIREGWRIQQLSTKLPEPESLPQSILDATADWMPAQVPAQVHEILLANGRIPDPHLSKNAADCTWVGEVDWVYATTFPSPVAEGAVFLCLDGLDTVATVTLNGQEIGRFENMYRQYRINIASLMKPGGEDNLLNIIFFSAENYTRKAEAQWGPIAGVQYHHYLRKCHSDYDSYLGARPNFIKAGIFDRVYLDVPDQTWLAETRVRPELMDGFKQAQVSITLNLEGMPALVSWSVTDPAGQQVMSGILPPGTCEFDFVLEDPRLWWPHTHGQPDMYQLHLELVANGETRDRQVIPFGVRQVKPILKDPETGEDRFAFEINGQRIFLRGACWSSLEGITQVWSEDRARQLLDLVVQGRMNVMRLWAEGIIPPQSFYDECDRRGILIWQDFMFGYNKHPSLMPGYAQNCRLELEEMVRRLRNHACLLLWCGGNENYMAWDFQFHTPADEGWEIFTQVMPDVVARLDPGRLFQRSSPFGGDPSPNWPLVGDWHDYTTITFSPESTVPLYASEIGRASPPSITSMRRYLSEEEIWPAGHDPRIRKPGQPAWPAMWAYRAAEGAWGKIGSIEEFCDATNAEDLIRVLGTAHGEYLQRRVERERRGVPDGKPDGIRRCWGNTVWRLNDSWPILYWSVIDYYLEPKIPYYFLKRAYDPILVCFENTNDRIFVWVVNDSPTPAVGQLLVRRMNFNGKVLGQLEVAVDIAPGVSKRCIDLTPFGPISLYDDFLVAEFEGSQNTYLLRGERYLRLPEVKISVQIKEDGIELISDGFARQVTLEFPNRTGAIFEDNFFDLVPGKKKRIKILNHAGGERMIVRAVNASPVELAYSNASLTDC